MLLIAWQFEQYFDGMKNSFGGDVLSGFISLVPNIQCLADPSKPLHQQGSSKILISSVSMMVGSSVHTNLITANLNLFGRSVHNMLTDYPGIVIAHSDPL